MSHHFDSHPSAKVPDLTGYVIQIISGYLCLVERVARGGWGVIYRAQSTADSTKYYAVKCIALSQMDDTHRAAIVNEIRLQKACARASPHVLQIIDYVEDRDLGIVFIISEFCDAGDLWDQIIREEIGEIDRTDERIRNTFIQILDAVAACHNEGVYHRDLKPENILLKDGGTKVILGDFGFATRKENTRDFCMGTFPFMSPEVRNRSYDPSVVISQISSSRADIWALGVILVNLVTGNYPWELASLGDPDFYTYFKTNPDHLYQNFPISREVDEILRSIFKLDPYQRTSIKDLRQRVLSAKAFLRSSDRDFEVNMFVDAPDRNSELEEAQLYAVNGQIIIDVNITTDIIDTFPLPPDNLQAPAFGAGNGDGCNANVRIQVAAPPDYNEDLVGNDQFIGADHSDSDSSEGPFTPETHAADNVAIAGVDNPSSLPNIPELGLDNALILAGAGIQSARNKAGAQGNRTGNLKEVVPFAPPGLPVPVDGSGPGRPRFFI